MTGNEATILLQIISLGIDVGNKALKLSQEFKNSLTRQTSKINRVVPI
jgi:hypothetical protein